MDFYNIAPPAEYRPKAKAAAMRAVELDDSLAEAHVASGKFVWTTRNRNFVVRSN